MYVHGVNEQEVFNADEAFEWLRKGQLRKRTAPTFLNMDSSRSHTVFTIRVVQVSSFLKKYVQLDGFVKCRIKILSFCEYSI